MDVHSGERWADDFCVNVELRDTKTVFFVSLLEQGEHWLRDRLRAEMPGKCHALPANATAMYAPEVRANSDEMRLNIRDYNEGFLADDALAEFARGPGVARGHAFGDFDVGFGWLKSRERGGH